MALSDTAKLVASLTLEDKFTKPLAGADKALSGFERHAGSLGKVGDQVSRGLGNLGRNVGLIGAAAAGFLAVQVTAGVSALVRLESAQAQTEAVLKSTKQVAGQTAESIRNLAEKYEGLNATIDDKVIQSGENILLTFTNVRKQAFEPALEAALNLNQALGGGEEGLQGNMILVGKALNDPIRGLTNLRRVGVSFSKAQEDQIKKLVAANDLYGAQKIILQELATEFGGQFARAGDTTAGKFAKVKDAIEDAQIALATAFLPLISEAADKLQTFLADPAVISRIKDFGTTLAGGLEKLVSIGENLPWKAIGDAFEFAGTASQAILDTFTKMPPWVQTAVLTGWGLNKLTGGALGDIFSTLSTGLIKGILGMNAGVVNINAAVVNGGVGGGGGVLDTVGKVAGGAGGTAAAITAADIAAIVAGLLAVGVVVAAGQGAFGGNVAAANRIVTTTPGGGLGARGTTPVPTIDAGLMTAQREGWAGLTSDFKRSRATAAQLAGAQNIENHLAQSKLDTINRTASRIPESVDGVGRNVKNVGTTLSGKNFSPTINVRTATSLYVTGRSVQAIITQQQLKVGTGPQEF